MLTNPMNIFMRWDRICIILRMYSNQFMCIMDLKKGDAKLFDQMEISYEVFVLVKLKQVNFRLNKEGIQSGVD